MWCKSKTQLLRHRPSPTHRQAVGVALRRSVNTRAEPLATQAPPKQRLLYDAVVFDMDGTLTEAHIDFADMRQRTGIPVGDLFVSMESWDEPERIKGAMDVILQIEAEAAQGVSGKEGLLKLLDMLRQHEVKVALVTRNTTSSVDAFFNLIGQEWRQLFCEVRTREFKYVKPDKRLLLDVAKACDVDPAKMLMVGDSFEDVECGNAAGSATCLIAGGGNEAPGSNIGPPPGAIPTMTVKNLTELQQILATTVGSTGSEEQFQQLLGWPARVGAGEVLDPAAPGAPAPGLDFVDFLTGKGALTMASCSFPKMGRAAGGLQACPVGGESVLHVGCGDGALTKMLASKGLEVVGVDGDLAAAEKRGLKCTGLHGGVLTTGSLAAAAEGAGEALYDVALIYMPAGSSSSSSSSDSSNGAQGGQVSGRLGLSGQDCLAPAALKELRTVLTNGGRLCMEVSWEGGEGGEAGIRQQVAEAGFDTAALEWLASGAAKRLRLVATAV